MNVSLITSKCFSSKRTISTYQSLARFTMPLIRTSRTKPTHILLLKTLLKISYVFSTAPYYDFKAKEIRKFKLYTTYSSCTFLLIIIGFLYSSIFISDDGAKGSSQSQQIGSLLEMLASLLLAIATLTAVSGALFKSDKWYYLLEQLENVDVKLGFFENDSATVAKGIYVKLLLIYLPKVCKDIYCIYAYSSTNLPKYLICNTIFEYYCFAPTLLLVSLALILKDEYKAVMGFLNNHQKSEIIPENNFVISELFTHYTTPGSYLRSMSKMFRLLNTILDNYNHIFGYQLLFMLGHTLLSVLQTFDYCLKYRETTSNDSTDVLFANLCITAFNLVTISFFCFHCTLT